ncbi:hypothetical protein EOPP23_13330 [Endozoicomonas sp. OPT23]|uniref:SRPBCC domain-containing protein n=1 Tax=Endozoicomonas sp. OPT23 TaxID=2072845 RepID=UPI00129B9E2F|nr:SRPBCC domain-containing protein [Endozoicomonas sp. OPT23]MRI33972.1 hypothetical protein [Endozoicomonas sp. OPT23]
MITKDAVYSDEIVINAPVELVWDILVNLEEYHKWNPFCPEAKSTLEIGSPIVMKVKLGEYMTDQTEYVTEVKPYKSLSWRTEINGISDGHRTQTLEKVDGNSCSYLSVDRFSGTNVEPMLAKYGALVEAGFNECAYGLKSFSEEQA